MASHTVRLSNSWRGLTALPSTINAVAGDSVTFIADSEGQYNYSISGLDPDVWTNATSFSLYSGSSATRTTKVTASGTDPINVVVGSAFVQVIVNVAPSQDTTPNQFTFNAKTASKFSAYEVSNTVTISGIDAASPVSISGSSGHQWRKNGGSWTSSNGTVVNGDTVQVRVTSSMQENTLTSATLNIGGVTSQFKVTTGYADVTCTFSVDQEGAMFVYFISVQEVLYGQSVKFVHSTAGNKTGTLTLTGFDSGVWTGGSSLAIPRGGHACLTNLVTQDTSDTVTARIAGDSIGRSFTIHILAPPDKTPNAYSFTTTTNVYPESFVEVTSTTITGINRPVPVSVTGADFSTDGGQTWSGQVGYSNTVENNGVVMLRSYSPAGFGTSKTVQVTVGEGPNRNSSWSIYTKTQPDPENLIVTKNTSSGFSFHDDVANFFGRSTYAGPVSAITKMSQPMRGSEWMPDIVQNNSLPLVGQSVSGLKLSDFLGTATYLSWERTGGGQYGGGDTTLGQTSDTISWFVSDYYAPGSDSLVHPRVGYGMILGACHLRYQLIETTGGAYSSGVTMNVAGNNYVNGQSSPYASNYAVSLTASTPSNTERIYRGIVRLTVRHGVFTDNTLTVDLPYGFFFKGQ